MAVGTHGIEPADRKTEKQRIKSNLYDRFPYCEVSFEFIPNQVTMSMLSSNIGG